MNIAWTNHSEHPCPSCAALDGQIHTPEQWEQFDIKPQDHKLYCQEHCSCTMDETDQPEQGDLSAVPLRQSALSAAGTPPLMEKNKMQKDITLQAKATPTETGFDMLAIDAGEAKGHGIFFSETALQEAVTLYTNRPVFIDHAGLNNAPSVRNLAGTISEPSWSPSHRGITAKLTPAGPAADILLAIRDAARTNAAIMEAVGFSTVLNVRLDKSGNVTKVVRVKSVDVVIDPARGGKFLSVYVQGQKGETMSEENNNVQERESTAALAISGANDIIADLKLQNEQARALQIEQCRILLDTALSASKIPAASQGAVRKPFDKMLADNVPFLASQLQEAIDDKRKELSALSENQIQGPGRQQVFGMTPSRDQFRLAVEDLLGAERDPSEANIKVHKLQGIREAYVMATGDQEIMGGFYPEYALVTANFPSIVANIQNKMLLKAWDQLRPVYGWWEQVVTVEHFTNLNDVAWLKTGTIASLPTVAERGEYQELPIGDNKETSSWEKFGGYVPLTIEAVLRDDVRAFRRMPNEVALAGMRNISEQVAEIFTSNSAVGPTLADTGALFNATAVTTAGGHANLLTTALGTDFTAWDAVATAVYNQPLLVKNATGYYGTGKKVGIEPSIILVPRALKAAAEALFIPRWDSTIQAAIASKGGPTYGGYVKPLTVPEWTDATDWAALVNPLLMPGIMIGEIFGVKPQIFSASSELDPAMFANDESRIKVRQFLAVGVADYRPLHKSNVV